MVLDTISEVVKQLEQQGSVKDTFSRSQQDLLGWNRGLKPHHGLKTSMDYSVFCPLGKHENNCVEAQMYEARFKSPVCLHNR